MRKLLTLMVLVVAGTAVLAGLASAAKPTGAVTISLSRPIVDYGSTVTLSGTVSNQQAGQKLVVLAQPDGQATFLPVATVDTTSGGAWTYTATPSIRTAYEAKWMLDTSQSVAVKVRPAISLSLVSLSSGTFSTKVSAARSFEGKFVLVQRLSSAGTATLKKVVLDSNSSATFRVRLPQESSRLRVVMPTSQTSPGYLAAASAVLVVHR